MWAEKERQPSTYHSHKPSSTQEAGNEAKHKKNVNVLHNPEANLFILKLSYHLGDSVDLIQ